MANSNNKSTVAQIFNDLDLYRNFCREYGYKFDERDLYSGQSYVWRQYQKSLTGKPVKDQWEADRIRFKEQQEQRNAKGFDPSRKHSDRKPYHKKNSQTERA
jgi:hypothetical protein